MRLLSQPQPASGKRFERSECCWPERRTSEGLVDLSERNAIEHRFIAAPYYWFECLSRPDLLVSYWGAMTVVDRVDQE